jgi:ABC-type polar amino acid transport system ATPase subunit
VSVSPALEVIGLHKRFTAGAASCSATISVLRGVDLQVERGEAAAIVGEAGSGRSTLLLCIAGLLSIDAGVVRRFGDDSRAAATQCTGYYMTAEQLWQRGGLPGPMLHLVDLRHFPALQLGRVSRWLADECDEGGAALIVADSVDLARHVARRVVILRDGRLQDAQPIRARVAESRFVDRPFERV